jgi:hypothetical protein
MQFSTRRIAGLLTVTAASLFIGLAGTTPAHADCYTTDCGYFPGSSDVANLGPFTGGISPITGYQQNGYGMESAWVDANQDTIYAHCPGSLAPLGPQQNLATITGELLQSNQGRQLTDTVVTTNDAYGCR